MTQAVAPPNAGPNTGPNQQPQAPTEPKAPIVEALEQGDTAQVDQIIEQKRINMVNAVAKARTQAVFGKRRARRAAKRYAEARDFAGGAYAADMTTNNYSDDEVKALGAMSAKHDAITTSEDVAREWTARSTSNKFLDWWQDSKENPTNKKRAVKAIGMLAVGAAGGLVAATVGGAVAGAAAGAYVGKRFAKTAAKTIIETRAAGGANVRRGQADQIKEDRIQKDTDLIDRLVNNGNTITTGHLTYGQWESSKDVRKKSQRQMAKTALMGMIPGAAIGYVVGEVADLGMQWKPFGLFGSNGSLDEIASGSDSGASTEADPGVVTGPTIPEDGGEVDESGAAGAGAGDEEDSGSGNEEVAADADEGLAGAEDEVDSGATTEDEAAGAVDEETDQEGSTDTEEDDIDAEGETVIAGDQVGAGDELDTRPQTDDLSPEEVAENLGAGEELTPEEQFEALAADEEQWAAFEQMVNRGNIIEERLQEQGIVDPAEIQARQMFSMDLAAIHEQMREELLAEGLDDDEIEEELERRTMAFFG